MSETPTERDLAIVAETIGNGWEMLAVFLSIDRPKVEKIKMDYPHSTAEQVFQLLLAWRRIRGSNASFEELFKSMQKCGSVSVDWDLLSTKLGSRFGMFSFYCVLKFLFVLWSFYFYATKALDKLSLRPSPLT